MLFSTLRGEEVLFNYNSLSSTSLQTIEGKMLWRGFTWTIGGIYKVTPICPSRTIGAFANWSGQEGEGRITCSLKCY